MNPLPVATFDFVSHLHLCTSTDSWDIRELTGGAANNTVRVGRVHVSDQDDIGGNPYRVLYASPSVVLKHAPAFLAKAKHIPFSPYRQTIEAAALRLFHERNDQIPFALGQVLAENPRVDVPRLLLHDQVHNIIIQSDLGAHPNLYDVLISGDTTDPLASELGRIIGRFLASMHDACQLFPELLNTLVTDFKNDDAERVMESVISQATMNMMDAGVLDYQVLGDLAMNHWKTRTKSAFSQGDLWFGTLLVQGLMDRQNPSTTPSIGICDWEFAGPNHPAADIAQLGAYLHLMSLSPFNTPRRASILSAFSDAFYESYFATIRRPFNLPEYRRSLVIMHGWELINAAGWDQRQSMWCDCGGEGIRCSHIREMVVMGAGLLRVALDDQLDVHALEEVAWARFFRILK